jgi:hypothetical protein
MNLFTNTCPFYFQGQTRHHAVISLLHEEIAEHRSLIHSWGEKTGAPLKSATPKGQQISPNALHHFP